MSLGSPVVLKASTSDQSIQVGRLYCSSTKSDWTKWRNGRLLSAGLFTSLRTIDGLSWLRPLNKSFVEKVAVSFYHKQLLSWTDTFLWCDAPFLPRFGIVVHWLQIPVYIYSFVNLYPNSTSSISFFWLSGVQRRLFSLLWCRSIFL